MLFQVQPRHVHALLYIQLYIVFLHYWCYVCCYYSLFGKCFKRCWRVILKLWGRFFLGILVRRRIYRSFLFVYLPGFDFDDDNCQLDLACRVRHYLL